MEVMSKVQQAIGLYSQSFELANRAAGILGGGPASFYYEKLELYVNALFTKFSPFHEGDRVALTVTPNVKGTGWSHCAHFLVAGAVGTVASIDYRKWKNGTESFVADVVFDDESWIDKDGNVRPVENKHTYHLREDELRLVESVRRADAA